MRGSATTSARPMNGIDFCEDSRSPPCPEKDGQICGKQPNLDDLILSHVSTSSFNACDRHVKLGCTAGVLPTGTSSSPFSSAVLDERPL